MSASSIKGMGKSVCLTTALILLLITANLSFANTFEPVFNPEMTISKVSGLIKIDGNLDDSGWKSAAVSTSFVERYPGDNVQPEVKTLVFITYDESHLYVAFKCQDNPDEIRATLSQRDQYGNNDNVGILIDSYGDASWAYEFFVNPYGVQNDLLWSSVAGDDSGFDMIWESAGKITSDGYHVEMAIPFSSMRFPNQDEQEWRVDFWRNRPRESRKQYSWSANKREQSCWPCQWGTVHGINNVSPGKGMELLPTFMTHQSGQLNDSDDPVSGFNEDDIKGELSLGGKYSISSDVTLEASYNPDFSQIESDAAQVDVNSTIALFYPERRPFFQEGADVFRTLFNSFYTRTVNDPEYAVKLVTRKPGFTLGFMSAQDESTPYLVPLEESSALFNSGRSYVNVLRGSKPVGQSSQLGFIVSDRRLDGGGYGTILALDGDIRLNQSTTIDGQFLGSFTGEPDEAGPSADLDGVPIDEGKRTAIFDGETFQGNAFITRLRRFARHWSFVLDYNQVDPSYRTLTGYDPWVNYRNTSMWNSYTFYPESGIFQRIQPQLWVEGRWLYDGTRRWERQNLNLSTQLRWAQTKMNVSFSRGSETWTSSVTSQQIEYNDLNTVNFDINSQLSDKIGYYFSVNAGRGVARFADATGKELSLGFGFEFKPIDRLVIEPDIDYVKSRDVESNKQLYRQFIARTRLRLQLSRQFSARLVVQYDDSRASILTDNVGGVLEYYEYSDKAWNIDPLVTYRLNSFSVLYAGTSQNISFYPETDRITSRWKLSSRQFFIKLQYLFQV